MAADLSCCGVPETCIRECPIGASLTDVTVEDIGKSTLLPSVDINIPMPGGAVPPRPQCCGMPAACIRDCPVSAASLKRDHDAMDAPLHAYRAYAARVSQQPDTKPVNPKDGLGLLKIPVHLWPASATARGSLALLDGLLKYGRSNYRATDVRASVYVRALIGHVQDWFEGLDADPKSGLHPLDHALANLAILVDADAAGTLIDDRMYPGGYHALVEKLTPHVARLQALHAGHKSPKHWTIQDKPLANDTEDMSFKGDTK